MSLHGPTLIALAAGVLALGLVFLPECRAALKVWSESTAYGHCFLVAPIALYMVWDRRDQLRGIHPCADPRLLVLAVPLPFAWFAAERLGIMEGRQLVALAFLELLFLTVLGWRLFRALLAPLLYLAFLVPFGAFITPALQAFTAHFIDLGLTVLGISHFANDMVIELSAGTFYVAEACAGLRFLIASVAFGVFYAVLNYRSPRRRAAFIAASIAVPIVANGIRALGIVVLGHILGSAEAAAADHIIYGWVFFSLVMLLLVAAGLPLREAPAPAPATRGTMGAARAPMPWAALGLVVVIAALAPGASRAIDRDAAAPALAAVPALHMPPGCEAAPARVAGASAVIDIACGDRTWTATLLTLSPRTTGSGVNEARSRLVGAVDPDDVIAEALHDLPPAAGAWTVLTSREPAAVIGTSLWLRGEPASGGLRQRVHLAIDSLAGTAHAPLLIGIATRPHGHLSDRDAVLLRAELVAMLAAQTDLATQVATLAPTLAK